MKTSGYFAAVSLSILATACAHAETYDGVHPPTTLNSRADVEAQAVTAAQSGNPYADGSSSGVTPTVASATDPDAVRFDAAAWAQRPNQNTPREAFVNSVVPTQYNVAPAATQQAGLNPSPQR